MDPQLRVVVASGGYAVDPHAVAAAMLESGRAPIPLKPPSDVLVASKPIDGFAPGPDQGQPAALEGTA